MQELHTSNRRRKRLIRQSHFSSPIYRLFCLRFDSIAWNFLLPTPVLLFYFYFFTDTEYLAFAIVLIVQRICGDGSRFQVKEIPIFWHNVNRGNASSIYPH